MNPLSAAQHRLWLLDQASPGSVEYLVPWAWRLSGPLDVDVLAAALAMVAERHEVLRTELRPVGGQLVQVVVDGLPVPLRIVDAGGRRPDAWVSDELARPFDLATAPLWRALVVRSSPVEHLLVFVWHHVVIDAWSAGILLRELSACYRAELCGVAPDLPRPARQYGDLARIERKRVDDEQVAEDLAYWRNQLAGFAPLRLPTDRPRREARSSAGAAASFSAPEQVAAGLRALAETQHVTLFMVLLAAVKVLLARYTGQPDVAVGTPWSTRHSVDSESLIGLFLDSLVLRTDLSGDPTFAELLRRVRDVTLGAYESGGLPFERLAAELGLGLAPFDVEFVVNNLAPASWTLPGVEAVEHHVAAGPARFDLTVAFGDVSAGLTGFIRYRTALFDRERIERMCEDLMTLLAAVALDPARRLSDVAVAYDGRTNRATSSPR